MITIKIGSSLREFSTIRDIEEGWILQQVNERRRTGENVGVRVTIDQLPLQITLATPNAQSGGGGSGRQPKDVEQSAFNLWNECGLNTNSFDPGRLIEFLKRVSKLVR